ncbi:MJ1255/VC2487 family glycosyltransferase [Holophaga foetida]|uniref:MJ1255/VC2487 family glycosyltransferase n=1 Tax=Holophaga foetida TaxID=35839 RepID=UPI0002474CDF|nr:MJ1255/VC2487 family glycosyltransferase [Holophaga foetida]
MKILYGVPSEGMGHATRSKVIVTHLLASGHDVRIATSDRAADFMEKAFPGRVFAIEGFHLRYDKGTVDHWKSFSHLVAAAPESLVTNVRQFLRVHRGFAPEAVISDFESFTYYFAKTYRLPILSVDNMQVINRCHLGFPIPEHETENYRLAKAIIKAKVPFCARYLVTSFFDAPPCKPRTEVVPPILRDAILAAKPCEADHILVYQTATSQSDLLEGLREVKGQEFRVYGFNRNEAHGQVVLKSFSEEGFIDDLTSCKAVLTNGGFSLISEAVYLHKPVLSFPLTGQFEQFVNGAQVERMGYGRRFNAFSPDAVKAFLYDLPDFVQAFNGHRQDGNQLTLAAVDRFLSDAAAGTLEEGEEELA